MTSIPPEAVEAAAKAEYEYNRDENRAHSAFGTWETLYVQTRRRYSEIAYRALAAAAPHLQRQTAEQIAAEPIRPEDDLSPGELAGWDAAMNFVHIVVENALSSLNPTEETTTVLKLEAENLNQAGSDSSLGHPEGGQQ